MWSKFLRSFALSTAALAALGSALRAADDIRQPDTSATSEAIELKELADFGAKPKDVATEPAAATPAKPKTGVPTRAKRKPAGKESSSAGATPAEAAPKGESAPKPEQTAGQPKPKTADDPLQPIPDPMESGPVSIEAASFKGVTPGRVDEGRRRKSLGPAQGNRPSERRIGRIVLRRAVPSRGGQLFARQGLLGGHPF